MPRTVKPTADKIEKVMAYIQSKGPAKKKIMQNHIGMKEYDLDHVLHWLRSAGTLCYEQGKWCIVSAESSKAG